MKMKSRTKTKVYVTRHGIMYWLSVGWWLAIFKWVGRLFLFCATAGFSIFIRRKKEVGRFDSKTTITK